MSSRSLTSGDQGMSSPRSCRRTMSGSSARSRIRPSKRIRSGRRCRGKLERMSLMSVIVRYEQTALPAAARASLDRLPKRIAQIHANCQPNAAYQSGPCADEERRLVPAHEEIEGAGEDIAEAPGHVGL